MAYEEALEAGSPGLIADLASASEAAEGALADVPCQIPVPEAVDTPLPSEAALLALMDCFERAKDEDEERRRQ